MSEQNKSKDLGDLFHTQADDFSFDPEGPRDRPELAALLLKDEEDPNRAGYRNGKPIFVRLQPSTPDTP